MERIDKATLDCQIQQAMSAHKAMKQRLQAAVRRGALHRPSQSIAADGTCGFGRWLHHLKTDDTICRSPHFRAVVTAHAGFHKAAGKIARQVENGQSLRAAEMINELSFRQAADVLMTEMMAWRRAI